MLKRLREENSLQKKQSAGALEMLQKEIALREAASRNALIERDTHIHNLNLTIMALQGSTSWKVTSPLRKLVSAIRRIVHGRSVAQNALEQDTSPELIGSDTAALVHVTPTEDGPLSYARWVEQFDTINDIDRLGMYEEIGNWKLKPLLSIIMPVYNPPIEMLREAIESVKAQVYFNWELCIADDASTDEKVRLFLDQCVQADHRIKVIYREENGHISKASNSALDIADGEFIVLMDNDDALPEHALFWVAKTINKYPDAAIIYSDEDKIDEQGVRSAPYFKTDWNPYLFRSHNMISHLGVYRKALVERVGKFRLGMEGSQDYDLALRCSEQVDSAQIIHIPRVLYHWRMHAGSTAMSGDEKPYAQNAGQKALDEHLKRSGIAGHAELLDFGMYRVHYDLPERKPLVSLIIPTRNAYALVRQCIESIRHKTLYPNYEIILVDNGSDDPQSLHYFELLSQLKGITVIRDDGEFNYSAINNNAVEQANGELVGLINNDIEVISPEWLDEMVSLALQPNAGAIGARLWYPDNRLQHGGVIMGPLTLAGHAHKMLPRGHHGYFGRASLIQGMSAVTAACLIVKKSVFQEVGGLNENDLKIAFNDVDFCLKIMDAGYQNVWTPNADLYHHESATRGIEDTPEKVKRFMSEVVYMQTKWKDVIANDPFYNPNLTFAAEDFSVAFPPRVND
ncbi:MULTISPECIES: glycosyltransferase family 2 protein [Pseudomonas]|uniref:glycosyltransferase family 2 protein n=1 Tax=Pseudomonas TaxID=286 RepID=UPI00072FAB70|nr:MULTISPECIES: glycosyltransferase family 2 protein [Pseudomonas]KTC16791.1 glycosyl transferase family 2 [Pseudomonas marginalis ICMP 11289]MCF8979260.1 glycosyltransferase [Pseudomonas syringae]VVM68076.1 Undecaprenyl-phosphate 4-deoxy-4-formamido-L-arabinose transferase [Pseudomonas fluorescens]MBI6578231.1 glycosyltransferase family 2 protein [Pseudomonas viridiflava]MBI6610820.1 glycosyltransferase family 2 protein [Pseudomonas viridiflava]